MKKKHLAILCLWVSQLGHAGEPSVFLAVTYSPDVPAVRIVMPAEYVVVPVSVQSDSRDPARRTDDMERALRAIRERIKLVPELAVRPGVISLATAPSKLSSAYDTSSAPLHVLGVLKPQTNVFAVTKRTAGDR